MKRIRFNCSLQAADLTKPLDKRLYKGTIPTCHDFNLLTRSSDSLELLIGFSAGQVQLLDPVKHEVNKLFNEEVSTLKQTGWHCFVSTGKVKSAYKPKAHQAIPYPGCCSMKKLVFLLPPG